MGSISEWNNVDTVGLPGANAVAAKARSEKGSDSALTANPSCAESGGEREARKGTPGSQLAHTASAESTQVDYCTREEMRRRDLGGERRGATGDGQRAIGGEALEAACEGDEWLKTG